MYFRARQRTNQIEKRFRQFAKLLLYLNLVVLENRTMCALRQVLGNDKGPRGIRDDEKFPIHPGFSTKRLDLKM